MLFGLHLNLYTFLQLGHNLSSFQIHIYICAFKLQFRLKFETWLVVVYIFIASLKWPKLVAGWQFRKCGWRICFIDFFFLLFFNSHLKSKPKSGSVKCWKLCKCLLIFFVSPFFIEIWKSFKPETPRGHTLLCMSASRYFNILLFLHA